jgi:hypothetical protein
MDGFALRKTVAVGRVFADRPDAFFDRFDTRRWALPDVRRLVRFFIGWRLP